MPPNSGSVVAKYGLSDKLVASRDDDAIVAALLRKLLARSSSANFSRADAVREITLARVDQLRRTGKLTPADVLALRAAIAADAPDKPKPTFTARVAAVAVAPRERRGGQGGGDLEEGRPTAYYADPITEKPGYRWTIKPGTEGIETATRYFNSVWIRIKRDIEAKGILTAPLTIKEADTYKWAYDKLMDPGKGQGDEFVEARRFLKRAWDMYGYTKHVYNVVQKASEAASSFRTAIWRYETHQNSTLQGSDLATVQRMKASIAIDLENMEREQQYAGAVMRNIQSDGATTEAIDEWRSSSEKIMRGHISNANEWLIALGRALDAANGAAAWAAVAQFAPQSPGGDDEGDAARLLTKFKSAVADVNKSIAAAQSAYALDEKRTLVDAASAAYKAALRAQDVWLDVIRGEQPTIDVSDESAIGAQEEEGQSTVQALEDASRIIDALYAELTAAGDGVGAGGADDIDTLIKRLDAAVNAAAAFITDAVDKGQLSDVAIMASREVAAVTEAEEALARAGEGGGDDVVDRIRNALQSSGDAKRGFNAQLASEREAKANATPNTSVSSDAGAAEGDDGEEYGTSDEGEHTDDEGDDTADEGGVSAASVSFTPAAATVPVSMAASAPPAAGRGVLWKDQKTDVDNVVDIVWPRAGSYYLGWLTPSRSRPTSHDRLLKWFSRFWSFDIDVDATRLAINALSGVELDAFNLIVNYCNDILPKITQDRARSKPKPKSATEIAAKNIETSVDKFLERSQYRFIAFLPEAGASDQWREYYRMRMLCDAILRITGRGTSDYAKDDYIAPRRDFALIVAVFAGMTRIALADADMDHDTWLFYGSSKSVEDAANVQRMAMPESDLYKLLDGVISAVGEPQDANMFWEVESDGSRVRRPWLSPTSTMDFGRKNRRWRFCLFYAALRAIIRSVALRDTQGRGRFSFDFG